MALDGAVGILAHDAGAANHIFAWLDSGLIAKDKLTLCLSGPAEAIYRNKHPGFTNTEPAAFLSRIDSLVSGTSWPADFEQNVRKLAVARNIDTTAVIDHWTHYSQRFTQGHELQLPHKLWVTDSYAEAIVTRIFPHTPITLQPNHFLDAQVAEVHRLELTHQPQQAAVDKLLFVMEPVPRPWSGSHLPGELQALEYFLLFLLREQNFCRRQQEIIIKPHPSDPPGKYHSWLETYNTREHAVADKSITITIDEVASLPELIAWSDTVIGCQTYAMVVALAAGRRVISALPDNAPPCVLPHEGIIHLRQLKEPLFHEIL